jgi:hypothetical protein
MIIVYKLLADLLCLVRAAGLRSVKDLTLGSGIKAVGDCQILANAALNQSSRQGKFGLRLTVLQIMTDSETEFQLAESLSSLPNI